MNRTTATPTGPHAAAIYVRISDDRRGEAAGVARQEKDCRELAEARGWPVSSVYRDNDVSAFGTRQRPEYQRLLADLRAGVVDAVVAYHPDRLHRSPRQLEDFVEVVEQAQAPVLTVKAGAIDLTTATGRQTARIIGAVARGESERMGERIRRKHEELATAGKPSGGGSRAFGFESDHLTIRADEARLIREAAQRVLAGGAMTAVVREWNAAGVKTVGGKIWDVTGLRQVLVSARISGRREHHGQVTAKAVWLGIIGPEDSDRLRMMLGPGRGRRPGPPRTYLLSGMLRCGRCNSTLAAARAPSAGALRATGERWGIAYACARHPRNRPHACGRLKVSGARLEQMIVEMTFAAIDSPALAATLVQRRKGSPSTLDAVAALETDLQRLAADFGEGRLPYHEWTAARQPLERRLDAARRRLDGESGAVQLNGYARKGVLARAWPTLPIDRKQAILGVLFESITISPADPQKRRNVFDPERVSVEWRF